MGNLLENVMKEIRKQFGEMSVLRLGDAAQKDVEAVSTGALGLDLALGVGGLPKGRIVELYGHESSGKTTLALHAVANVQKAGGTAAFIDAEHALDPGYARKIGVDLANLVVSQPSSGEEALTICEELVKSGAVDIVVVDSVAALVPQAEIDGAMGDSHVGLQARLMSQAMRKLTAAIAQTKTLCIFTNQVREKIGVNLADLIISQPNSGEEALSICEHLAKSGALDVIVVDSVAALTPQAEIDGAIGDSHVGLQARLMSQAMRKLTAAIAQSGTLCIFTNQVREKIGVMFGNPETTPGGKALKFYASCRLQVQRIGAVKNPSGEIIGSRTRVKVVKNKVAPPFTEAEFDILYSRGISWEGSLVDAAMARGVVEKRGSWLSFGSRQLGQGACAAAALLAEDKALAEEIAKAVKEAPPVAKSRLRQSAA